MKIDRNNFVFLGIIAFAAMAAPTDILAATNGFVVPSLRGSANSEAGYWEVFSVPAGAPGNLPDQPGATTDAVLTQTNSSSFLGGMAARNHADAKQDLISLSLVQRFDPRSGRWEDVAPLPAPRSSHDAVIGGGKLYVAGGWQLAGGTNKPAWPANALVLDLTKLRAGWREFPQPFQRRALALAALGSRVFCIGGMDSDNQPTLAVDIYDTANGQWTKGPDLPMGKHKGFSCSAIAQCQPGFHAHRTTRRHRDHRVACGDVVARLGPGQRQGPGNVLPG